MGINIINNINFLEKFIIHIFPFFNKAILKKYINKSKVKKKKNFDDCVQLFVLQINAWYFTFMKKLIPCGFFK